MEARGDHLLGIMIKILLEFMKIFAIIGFLWQKVFKNSHLCVYSGLYFYYFLRKFPTYTFIQSYTFISFPKKNPTYTFIWIRRLFRTLEYIKTKKFKIDDIHCERRFIYILSYPGP